MGNCSTKGFKEAFEDVSSDDGKLDTPIQHTPNRMVLLDPRSPLVDAERTPIEILENDMASCSVSGIKTAFKEVPKAVDNSLTQPIQDTPERMAILDPRSPLFNGERTPIEVTPIEVMLKSIAITDDDDDDDDDEAAADDGAVNRRQLPDPRSATAGIKRTPILVESPLQLVTETGAEKLGTAEDNPVSEEEVADNITSTPVLVVQTKEKVLPMAKKLTFDVSPIQKKSVKVEVSSLVRTRSPLADLQANSSAKSDSPSQRQVASIVKTQAPLSPLELLHVRQRMAVKRALQRTQNRGENCPPQAVDPH